MLKRKKCYNIIYYKLTTLVFLYKEMPKIQKIDENSCYWQRKSSYLLNNLRNFNAIFRKGTTYGNIKSHKKTGFHPLLRRYIFGKTTIGGHLSCCLQVLRIRVATAENYIVKEQFLLLKANITQ